MFKLIWKLIYLLPYIPAYDTPNPTPNIKRPLYTVCLIKILLSACVHVHVCVFSPSTKWVLGFEFR